MTITTRSKTGKTPKKTAQPGFVETPGAYKRSQSRKSVLLTPDDSDAQDSSAETTVLKKEANGTVDVNSVPIESTEKPSDFTLPPKGTVVDGWEVGTDPKIDASGHRDFGGAPGVTAMMIGFPILMYYMWIGATYYDGHLPTREPGQSTSEFLQHLVQLVYTGAFPHRRAWIMYWAMFVFEGFLYLYAPGVYTKGKRLLHENGKSKPYYCSAIASWWITNVVAFALHFSGVFRLYTLIDEFGPLMSVAIISGFGVAIAAYVSALYRGQQHRMTGNHIYDFFMGAELNPRMFGWLDFKMFFEVRLPWYILYFLTVGMCARQYERYGYVSGEACLLFVAHFLYANACSKGEELIVQTWDMYYEKWGFMLIFWNMAGVPLSYCHCTIYLANHDPTVPGWNRYLLAFWFVLYLFWYWVWDTANGQKSRFRGAEAGANINRWTFPPLPYAHIKNPKVIKSPAGTLLVDGWYGKARKIQYTADFFFAVTWGLVTGFDSVFPWFYSVFFAGMIIHRAIRDIQRCKVKYGDAWTEYERQVPYLFVPYVF